MATENRITDPTTELWDLDDIKDHAKVEIDDDDHLARIYLRAATGWCENWTRRAFLTQTWRMTWDFGFPSDTLDLERPPLQSVTAANFVYASAVDTFTQVPTTVYTTDTESGYKGRVFTKYNQVWPSVTPQRTAVKIEFVAGFGDDPDDVPESIRQAVALLFATWYENRTQAVLTPGIVKAEIPFGVKEILSQYRIEAA